jgi:hypothetical protein
MAITKTTHYKFVDGKQVYEPTSVELYAGRVLKVEDVTESRNFSDTFDYTDFRTTTCTYALVWMGTRGIPTEYRGGRDVVWYLENDVPEYRKGDVRDLEFHEQFAWVDCTNIFSDRNNYSLSPAADAIVPTQETALMWANYIAWQAHQKALEEAAQAKALADAEAARKEAAERAKIAAAKVAKKAAKDASAKAIAEGMLARIPAKGTEVTVDGFTGKVFWTGATKYYGKWSARAGVKDSKGNVQWVPAEKF